MRVRKTENAELRVNRSMRKNEKLLSRATGGWSAILLNTAGYAAAAAFCVVSIGANLRYGISLGHEPVDKSLYAAASVAADAFKIMLPLVMLRLWARRHLVMSLASLALWLGCVGWSLSSAVGFALASRSEAVAERAATAQTRNGWEATVERAETQLSTLGRHRPVAVIRAELEGATAPPLVWQRTKECTEVTHPESRSLCAPVLRLRQELAAAEAAERLEGHLVAGREQLAALPVAGLSADPQASALARLAGLDEVAVRTGLALLLAMLVEAGSALGFTLLGLANVSQPTALNTVTRPAQAPTRRSAAPPRPSTSDGALERWVLTRLDVDPGAEIPARAAYDDFCRWARTQRIEPCSETRFGTDFTFRVGDLGGRKVKRRDRAYYVGVALSEAQTPALLKVAA